MFDRGLVGYWSPWLRCTGGRLLDWTRYANHGTLTSMDPPTDWLGANILGRSGRVLDFDGSNDHVIVPDSDSLDVAGQLSISLWVRTGSDITSVRLLLAKAIISPLQLSYRVWLQNSRLNFQVSQDGGLTNVGTRVSSILSTNTWYFFCCRFSPSTIQDTFINGTLENSSFTGAIRASINVGATPLILGAQAATSTTISVPFVGQIAEAAVWNRTLTESEIRSLYQVGPGWFGRREPRRRYAMAVAATGFRAYWARRQSQIIGGGL